MHATNHPTASTQRKGPTAEISRKKPLSPILARRVEQRISELHAEGCPREYSAILAREFQVSEATIDRLVAALMLAHRAEAATLRTGVAGSLDEACRRAGVSFRLYDLRHTFATRLAESGCDINTLAAILGHSGLRLLTRYVHPTDQHRAGARRRLEQRFKPALRRVK